MPPSSLYCHHLSVIACGTGFQPVKPCGRPSTSPFDKLRVVSEVEPLWAVSPSNREAAAT